MRMSASARSCLALAALLAVPQYGYAEEYMRPGLWEQHELSFAVDDGRKSPFADQIAAGRKNTQQIFAQAQGRNPNFSKEGNLRTCITPEQAQQLMPPTEHDEDCTKTVRSRTDHHLTIDMVCNMNGHANASTIDIERAGTERLLTSIHGSVTLPNGEKHTMHTEMENRFIAADCGGVTPRHARAERPRGNPPPDADQ